MNEKKEERLIAYIGLAITALFVVVYFFVLPEVPESSKWGPFLSGLLPNAIVATIAFPIIFFVFKKYGFFYYQPDNLPKDIDKSLIQDELHKVLADHFSSSQNLSCDCDFDIFISSPMAGFSAQEEFVKMREDVLKIKSS